MVSVSDCPHIGQVMIDCKITVFVVATMRTPLSEWTGQEPAKRHNPRTRWLQPFPRPTASKPKQA